MRTAAGGIEGQTTLLPLRGALGAAVTATASGGIASLPAGRIFPAQLHATAVTLSRVRATLSLTTGLSLIGTTIDLRVKLIRAAGSSPTTGAQVGATARSHPV